MRIINPIVICIKCNKDISFEKGFRCPYCRELSVVDSILQVTEEGKSN